MNEDLWLSAVAPRQLRVRGSIQVAQVRVSVPVFLLAMVIVFVGGIAVVRGADLPHTIEAAGVVLSLGVALIEGRWWGYSTAVFARALFRHTRRQQRMTPGRPVVVLAATPQLAERQVRWSKAEVRDAR